MKPAEFKALLERYVAEERANPTPIEELETFEKEIGFKLRGDFKDSLVALYVAAQPTKTAKKRGSCRLIFGEIVALLAVLGASGFGISALVAYAKKADAEQARVQARSDRRQQELRDALKSRDYRKLDDFILLYSNELSDTEKKQLQIRRDELYVEANP